jgi:hypothetical protein
MCTGETSSLCNAHTDFTSNVPIKERREGDEAHGQRVIIVARGRMIGGGSFNTSSCRMPSRSAPILTPPPASVPMARFRCTAPCPRRMACSQGIPNQRGNLSRTTLRRQLRSGGERRAPGFIWICPSGHFPHGNWTSGFNPAPIIHASVFGACSPGTQARRLSWRRVPD